MPREYKPKPGARKYKKYSEEELERALQAIDIGVSYRNAVKKFKLSRSVLERHYNRKKTGAYMKRQGGQLALEEDVEKHLVQRLFLCGKWRYPMDKYDLCCIVKGYLDRKGVQHAKFKNNMPSIEWAKSFSARNGNALSERMRENIKRSRAAISPDTINNFFDNLQDTLENVPANNILNYDETNLSDDPGKKKVIIKHGSKYPERVMNVSKSATSLMFAASADGTLLFLYVVYKSTNMYDT